MALSDMKVFEDFAYSSLTETVDQQYNLFNSASGGAIRLVGAHNGGDIKQQASFKAITNMIRRRNAYGNAALTPTPLQQRLENSVKVPAGTSPIVWQPQQLSYIQQDQEEAGIVIGEQLAAGVVKDQLNTAIECSVAAIAGNANVLYDGTAVGAGTATFSALNLASALFGDHSQNIVAWVMHSKVAHDLYGNALTQGAFLFNYGTVNVQRDPFGRIFVITDSPALFSAGNYLTLGLVADAVFVEGNDDYNSATLQMPGNENIQTTFQAEWTYNVGIHGYSWSAATGGVSPTDTALATSANWTKTASFDKMTAGIVMKSK